MKKLLGLSILFLLTLSVLAGCVSSKVFEKSGMKITADSSFKEVDYPGFSVVLESKDIIITGNRQLGLSFAPPIGTLTNYTERVIEDNSLAVDYISYNEGDVVFDWFIYERTIEGMDFTYFGVTKKGADNYFYMINFACEAKNFTKYESKFMDWAKLVVVE
ncbi:MAG: hypothetical protein FWG51_05120 [Firmicutes bacterium]|nr:hypothetical protein [Bacillota bacterium]